MSCPSVEQLEALAAGALDETTSVDVTAHLANCSTCQQLADDVKANLGVGAEIARLADQALRTPEKQPLPELPGYRILREIGRGGSGIVYEAEQDHPRRHVALKVFRGRLLDEYHRRLFQREAEALARLKHPGIAAIYEAHGTDDNLPYFVMELVEGEPLERHAQRATLSITQRLHLFREICDAVHYAHQRGVIHRDLKPGNILIDQRGKPKVLDFGLSRISDDDRPQETMVTEVGRIQGTLHYMSPEQARGNPDEIDLRADVYALGVILFQLLTYKLPYQLDRGQLLESLRMICEDDPQRPRSLNPRIDQDLERLILKAIEKDPVDRYQSAAALGEEVERYLNNEPLLVAPHTFRYQLRKLVARHKLPFAAVGSFVALVIAFGAWMSVLYGQAEKLRKKAETERVAAIEARELADKRLEETLAARLRTEEEALRVTAINDFLRKILASADPTVRVEEMRVSELLVWAAENAETEFAEDAETRAALLHTIGTALLGRGLLEQAEENLRKSLSLRIEVLGEEHENTQITMNNFASTIETRGKLEEAEHWKRKVLDIRMRLLGPDHRSTRLSRTNLANLLQSQGKLDEAGTLLRENLEALERTQPDSVVTLSTRNSLALLLWELGKYEEAEPLLRKTADGLTEQFGEEHPHTLRVKNNLALVLKDLKRIDDAIALQRYLLEVRERLLGVEHLDTMTSQHNLASSLLSRGDVDEAETLAVDAARRRRETLGMEHEGAWLSISLVGEIRMARKDYEQARDLFGQALRGAESVLPEDHWRLGDYRCRYAAALCKLGQHEEAEPLLRRGVTVLQAEVGEGHPYTQRGIQTLVELYEATGDTAALDEWKTLLVQETN